jgi:hypothetical protein
MKTAFPRATQSSSRQGEILNFLLPKPSQLELINVGGDVDGGYLVPGDFGGVDACFSPGVGGTKAFEDELWSRFGVRSHMADFSVDPAFVRAQLIEGAQTFEKKWIAPSSDDVSLSLEDWVGSREAGTTRNLVLQMDVEGAEYAILASIRRETLDRFRYLVIELHDLPDRFNKFSRECEFDQAITVLSASFVVVHARQNNCCSREWVSALQTRVPKVIEVTLVSRDFLDAFSGRANETLHIPHPNDISRNVQHKPPTHLPVLWAGGNRSFAASLKMIVDLFDYWFAGWPVRNLLKNLRAVVWATRFAVPASLRASVLKVFTRRKESR